MNKGTIGSTISKAILVHVIICFFGGFAAPCFADLKIDSLYPTLGKLGEDLKVEIRGSGFDADTRVTISADTGNAGAVIGSVDTPEQAFGVFVSGTLAYVADGNSGLQVIDISNPASPTIIGSVDTEFAHNVHVSGSIACLADYSYGLKVIDVSDPTEPVVLSTVDPPECAGINCLNYANDVYVSDAIAYVAWYDSGLQVVDVSDPLNPIIVSSVETPGRAYGVDVSGTTAYVADGSSLQIIDVSDPTKPITIGSIDSDYGIRDIFVSGTMAYASIGSYDGLNTATGFLSVIDVSIPSNPSLIGSIETPDFGYSISVSGTTAYMAMSDRGLQVIDVSDSSQLKLLGSVDTPGEAYGVAVSGSIVCVADYDYGLQVIDASVSSDPTIFNYFDIRGAVDVYVSGTVAYVSGWDGLDVLDISVPSMPSIIGSLETRSSGEMYVSDDLIYLADSTEGLKIIDISDPYSPVIIGSIDVEDRATGVHVSGTTALLANDDLGVQIIDVSDSSKPSNIGSIDIGSNGYASGVYISESKAYVVGEGLGLSIYDISDTANPTRLSSVDVDGDTTDVSVSGTYALVTWKYREYTFGPQFGGLKVIDISEPTNPNIVGAVDTPDYAVDIYVSGGIAYVGATSAGLQMIDVSDHSSPTIIGVIDTPYSAYGMYVSDSKAYIADIEGLLIAPVPEEIQSLVVNDADSISCTLSVSVLEGDYNLRVFNASEYDELKGAVSFHNEEDYWQLARKKAVIVAGGGPYTGNALWASTQKCTDMAYQAMLTQGYTRNSIYYLSPENTDADNDGAYNDIDGNATLSELSYAINTWAGDTNELLLYFTDHGGTKTFQMNESEILNVSELDSWLDDLQTDTHMRQIVVYDACYSGSFQDQLLPPSGEERIVITSTKADEPAWFVNDGTLSFSYQFWGSVMLDGNLSSSFSTAVSLMSGEQTPLINADGNGYTNESGDYSIANGITICRGRNVERNQPRIGKVCDDQTLNGETSASIWVSDVTFENGLSKIWAVVEPPGFDDLSTDVPVTDLPTFDLTDTDGDGTYTGSYDGFTFQGDYTVTIYAVDEDDIYSYPAETMVTQNQGITALYVIASPGGGTYNTSQSVQLVASSDAAAIYYSFDSDPTTSSNAYAGPITISSSTTLKFMAVDSSGAQSSIYSESYIIDTTAPSAPDISGSENSSTTMNPYPTLCWNEVLDADYYVLQYSASSDFSIYIEVTYLRTDSYTLATALTDYGTWYWRIKAVDAAGNASNWSTGEITYEQDTTVHKAIVALGYSADTDMSDAMDIIAKQAYSALAYQGFDSDSIYALGSDTSLDLDGNGSSDITSTASKTNLQTGITSWALGADDLIVFLIGESSDGAFNLSLSETLAGTDLDTWLDTLQTGSATDTYVIYDAPNSGSFLSSLIPPSGSNRIVLTSSSSDETSCYLKDGSLSFSYQFWLQIINSANLYEAFVSGKNMMAAYQQPQIDADGDGTGNEKEDQTAAVDIEIGYGRQAASTPPSIGNAYADQMVGSGTSTTIWAENITSLNPISQVWAMISPPNQATSGMVVTDLSEISLTDVDGDGQYEGAYTGLTTDGEYTLSVYAKDSLGYFASPKTFKVSKGQSANTGGSVNFTTPISVGDSIILSALILGETRETYYYRFGFKPKFNTSVYGTAPWIMLQDWSTSSTCTTSFAETGSYIWTVDVADSPSPSETLSMMGGVVNVGDISQPVLTGFDLYYSGTTLDTGDSVTFCATSVSSSGKTPYYLFGYKSNFGTDDYATSPWVKLQDWSTSNTCTTSFDEAGTYIITVDVSDHAGYPTSGLLQLMGGSVTVN